MIPKRNISVELGINNGIVAVKYPIINEENTVPDRLPKPPKVTTIIAEIKILQPILGIIGIFALPGMIAATIRAVARGHEGIYRAAIKTSFRWAWLGSLIIAIISYYYLRQGQNNFFLLFLILSVVFPFFSISEYYQALLKGRKRFDLLAKYTIVSSILSTTLLALTILIYQKLYILVLVNVLLQTTIAGFLTLYHFKKIKTSQIDTENLNYGKQLSLIEAFNLISFQIDKLLLVFFLGFEQLATYVIAIIIPDQLRGISKNIQHLSLPKFAVWHNKNLEKNIILKYFYKLLVLAIIIIIIYILIAPWLIKVFYPRYLESVKFSQVFILTFIASPFFLLGTFLQAQKKIKQIWQLTAFSAGTQIILLVILIPLFGLWGAIWARVVARFFNSVFTFIFFKKS